MGGVCSWKWKDADGVTFSRFPGTAWVKNKKIINYLDFFDVHVKLPLFLLKIKRLGVSYKIDFFYELEFGNSVASEPKPLFRAAPRSRTKNQTAPHPWFKELREKKCSSLNLCLKVFRSLPISFINIKCQCQVRSISVSIRQLYKFSREALWTFGPNQPLQGI